MSTLILMRHAKAVAPEEAESDAARRLSPRGRRDAARAARRLAKAGLAQLDVALISPSARTTETWDILAATLAAAQLRIEPALYMAAPDTLERLARGLAGERALLLGHNPGLRELGLLWSGEGEGHDAAARGRLLEGFPTSWALVFAFDGPLATGRPRLVALLGA